MKLLIYDLVQSSDAPSKLKTASLADKWIGNTVSIGFGAPVTIDCIGIGNTDATQLTVNGETVILAGSGSTKNGLYEITPITVSSIVIVTNGTYIGRVATGKSRFLGVSPAREPGLWSSNQARMTLSGQSIPGAGGITGRKIDVDIRYKIDREIFEDIEKAYSSQIGCGYPLFVLFDIEQHRIPWARLYGQIDENMTFQSSVNKFLYSKKLSFEERF